MKLLFILLIFLAPISTFSDSEFIGEVNKRRRAFAKKHTIANMHELIWDKSLVEELQAVVKNKKKFEDSGRYWSYMSSYDFGMKLIDEAEGKLGDQKGPKDHPFNSWLKSEVKKVGCFNSNYLNATNFEHCFMTPCCKRNVFEEKGEPGSKCDNGYENNDGLCSLPGSSAPVETKESKDKESGEKAVTDSESSSSSPLVFYTFSVLTSFFLVLF